MSRDYKNIRNKNKAGSQEKSKSNLLSFLVGLALGAFITGSIFLNQHKQIVDVESSAIFIDKNNTEDKEDNEKNINTEITFDFPTMLEERQVAKIPEKKYKDEKKLSRPKYWSGWCLRPTSIEFWLHRENRIHERLRYRKTTDEWEKEILYP